ncbi:hypothetical protein [uncultured Sphingomonas sp.]|uniref:hypothetical protein n=1 Tax=uncultured Sphingomonas sp. TaxID=158754 RepID=UPI0025CF10BE|nr:hypothetical protein [uncultured Sphingomonas sp.]
MSRRSTRRSLRAATVLAGLAIGFVALGRSELAIASAALWAIVVLHVLYQLSRGDR